MNLTFDVERLLLPVSVDLQDALNRVLGESGKWTPMIQSVVINFRDGTYSAENGGYHPVEIRLVRNGEQWIFDYITDFAYHGYPFAELVKEIDFDFGNGVGRVVFQQDKPITCDEIEELYQLWENNFIAYYETGAFDEVEVTVH
ncbi:TPA: DUF2787 domain-containing protein [Vibrio harveyi]|nr:DUF2787 domain-containing protein [Vibrio harveyi]